jgi:hypothetical protein
MQEQNFITRHLSTKQLRQVYAADATTVPAPLRIHPTLLRIHIAFPVSFSYRPTMEAARNGKAKGGMP